MDLVFNILTTLVDYHHYPLAQVSRKEIDKMRKKTPNVIGRPIYFSVERTGYDLHIEVFPELTPEAQS